MHFEKRAISLSLKRFCLSNQGSLVIGFRFTAQRLIEEAAQLLEWCEGGQVNGAQDGLPRARRLGGNCLNTIRDSWSSIYAG